MAREPNRRTSSGAIAIAPPARVNRPRVRFGERVFEAARQLESSAWWRVLAKAAGIACGMLALAAIGALATARGLGGQRVLLAEPPASSATATADDAPGLRTAAGRGGTATHAALASPLSQPLAAAPSAPSASTAPGTPPAATGMTADGKVILNRASVEELGRLPGIGPKRALAIFELRQRMGRFRRTTDLLRVKGIGPKSLKKLEPHFVLDPPP